MTLRRKFIFALVGMVFFMAVVFTTIAYHASQSLLGRAETYVQQASTQRLNQFLSLYYEGHGGWDGVQDYVLKVIKETDTRFNSAPLVNNQPAVRPARDLPQFLVFNQQNIVVVDPTKNYLGRSLAQFPSDFSITKQWVEIKVDGQIVGHFWQDQHSNVANGLLARTIGASIIQAMIIGLIITSMVALLLSLLLTRHFTKPLNKLMIAVRNVGKGDLSSRVKVKGKDDIALLARDFNHMAEELARNEGVRRNMVADIAHELRTPLSVILGKLESIQEGVLPSTPETILPIHDETLRLIRLVRDLQQLSLAEAGKLPMVLHTINLRQIVERITEQFAIEFDERGLTAEVIGDAPEVTGDLDRLTQVFVNLIGNALLHTPSGGSLLILLAESEKPVEEGEAIVETAHRLFDVFRRKGKKIGKIVDSNSTEDAIPSGGLRADGWAQVTILDSGEGIPTEELEHIFDRFYRVDKSRERESGGTGLGLAIAKEFIQAHGGTIQVKSELGVGSSFIISLPINRNVSSK